MTHVYPRNRKEIIAVNGVWDPCQNITEMAELWTLTGLGWWTTNGVYWTQVASPGAIGGYCHKLDGVIGNLIYMYGICGLAPYKNTSFNHYFSASSAFYWKMRAEFRLRIEADQTNGATGSLSHCLGFAIDGNVLYWAQTSNGVGCHEARTNIMFNVTDSLIAITNRNFPADAEVTTSTAWSGSYDTWYDIRIEWSQNWYAEPNKIPIEVFVNNVSVLQYDLSFPTDNRSDNHPDLSQHSVLGRCGPTIYVENDGGASNGDPVTGYFKDILITQDCRPVNWETVDSIIQHGKSSTAKVEITSNFKSQFGEGADLKIWKRLKKADDWASRFRGIIREVNPKERKHVVLEAEGYESILYGEKTNNLTHTTKTAGFIVADAINNPDKGEFDVSTYFDTTTVTYTREYRHNKKMMIITEMADLEGFIVFIDWRNNWHFESYRTNQLSNHLIWGQSKIIDIQVSEVFVRRPNKVRVIGKGYTAEREITVNTYASASEVVRDINRLDLDSQLLVDAALDSYIIEIQQSIKAVTVSLRADHSLKKGHLIRVTSPMHGLRNHQFLITSIGCNNINRMTLELLEARPLTSALLSETISRIDVKEEEMFPSDHVVNNDEFNLEGQATVLINGTYEVEYDSSIVDTGKVVINDEFMDDLVEVWNNESPTQPTHLGYGTGTTEPLFNDTTLESESARAAASVARAVNIGNATTPAYRSIEYSIIVSSPSGVTELALFNAASNGTMACRVVIPSYTQSGSVTLRIRLTVIPLPGYAFVSVIGVRETTDWMYDGSSMGITHMSHCGFRGLTSPTPYSHFVSTAILWPMVWWVPDTVTPGTFSKSKLYDRNAIKYTFVYPDYDVADEGTVGTGDDTQQERFVGLEIPHDTFKEYEQYVACLMHRSRKDDDDYQGFACKWILWIKFVAGEIEHSS